MKYFINLIYIFIFPLMLSFAACNSNNRNGNETAGRNDDEALNEQYTNTPLEQPFKKLKSGATLSASEIERFAADLSTRADLYALLQDFNKSNLFPRKYYSFERAGESVLANWLNYPTELDTIPSEIHLLKKVEYREHDSSFIYYVFQFKTEAPHWAAKDGWMTGVVGPYFENSQPYDFTRGTFSKFEKVSETTPEKQVTWVHQNVFRTNPG